MRSLQNLMLLLFGVKSQYPIKLELQYRNAVSLIALLQRALIDDTNCLVRRHRNITVVGTSLMQQPNNRSGQVLSSSSLIFNVRLRRSPRPSLFDPDSES